MIERVKKNYRTLSLLYLETNMNIKFYFTKSDDMLVLIWDDDDCLKKQPRLTSLKSTRTICQICENAQ